jgi:hypothetical protein
MEQTNGSALEQLRKKVISQKSADFPRDPVDDAEVDAARIRLEDLDQLVTQLVIQVIGGNPIQVTMDQEGPDLDSELSALHETKPEALKKRIEKYQLYKERLDTLLHLAVQASKEMHSI